VKVATRMVGVRETIEKRREIRACGLWRAHPLEVVVDPCGDVCAYLWRGGFKVRAKEDCAQRLFPVRGEGLHVGFFARDGEHCELRGDVEFVLAAAVNEHCVFEGDLVADGCVDRGAHGGITFYSFERL
jgi:hypothetical protein